MTDTRNRPGGTKPGAASEQVGETEASIPPADDITPVQRWRRIEVDRCPRGTWSVVRWARVE